MKFNYKNSKDLNKLKDILSSILTKDTVIICIGTNREIADSLAPFVGMILAENNTDYKVYGTIYNPIHSDNLEKKIKEIKMVHKNSTIIAIDAGLDNGRETAGDIILEYRALNPGLGVKKILPAIGDVSIIGIVGNQKDLYRGNIRLDIVIDMAKAIASCIK